jgi:hypothetical protein
VTHSHTCAGQSLLDRCATKLKHHDLRHTHVLDLFRMTDYDYPITKDYGDQAKQVLTMRQRLAQRLRRRHKSRSTPKCQHGGNLIASSLADELSVTVVIYSAGPCAQTTIDRPAMLSLLRAADKGWKPSDLYMHQFIMRQRYDARASPKVYFGLVNAIFALDLRCKRPRGASL